MNSQNGSIIESAMLENSPSCLNCGFYAFCSTEDANAQAVYEVNCVVKKQLTLKKNQPLYFPKNKFNSLYVVQSGCIKTYEVDQNGNELITGFYFAGEVLGFEAIARGNYHFSAKAFAPSVVCEIPYDHFIELLSSHTHLQKRIMHLMSGQLLRGNYLNYITAEQRLAAFLIDLSERLLTSANRIEFLLPMSREDIGNYLGLAAETISRLFSQFKLKKIIAIENKKIQLLDVNQLKIIAGIPQLLSTHD